MNKNKDSNYDESTVLINPVIVEAKGHTRFSESCESCLDYVGTIDRSYLVEVEYFGINGNKVHDVFDIDDIENINNYDNDTYNIFYENRIKKAVDKASNELEKRLRVRDKNRNCSSDEFIKG